MAENNNVNNAAPQQELNELLQIRRDKLKALQDEGRDPFTITRFEVSHLRAQNRSAFARFYMLEVQHDPRIVINDES